MNRKKNSYQLFYLLALVVFGFSLVAGCGEEEPEVTTDTTTAASQGEEDMTQMGAYRRNIENRMKESKNRFTNDTLSLAMWILDNYPAGSFLMTVDEVGQLQTQPEAVIYRKKGDSTIVYGILTTSKPDDNRIVEMDNIIGYYTSFIDFDSTELGTAIMYLGQYRGANDQWTKIWDVIVPRHGGFNKFMYQKFPDWNQEYIKVNIYFAEGRGHLDFNYFFTGGIDSVPHLMMTYEGLNFKRTMTNANNDKYPDYVEYVFVDDSLSSRIIDSVTFIWKDTAYFSVRNPKHWRPY